MWEHKADTDLSQERFKARMTSGKCRLPSHIGLFLAVTLANALLELRVTFRNYDMHKKVLQLKQFQCLYASVMNSLHQLAEVDELN